MCPLLLVRVFNLFRGIPVGSHRPSGWPEESKPRLYGHRQGNGGALCSAVRVCVSSRDLEEALRAFQGLYNLYRPKLKSPLVAP